MAVTTPLRSDPLRNFKFQVEIYYMATNIQAPGAGKRKLADLGFMSVSGLSMTTEMIPYREGGMNTVTRKMPGQSDFPPITFQRGLFQGHGQLFDWFKDIFFIDAIGGEPNEEFRTSINIRVLPHPAVHYTKPNLVDTEGGPKAVKQAHGKGRQVFQVVNAWPTSMSWSDLDAGGNGIIMEQLTVVHEGLVPVYASSDKPTSFASWHLGA